MCGKFRILVSLRFYVKSILDILERVVVFAFLEAVNFVILVNYSGLDKSAKILQNPNSDPKMC